VIFLDATSAAVSPKNTGVQRMARGLFRSLSTRSEVTPVCWSTVAGGYVHVARREQRYLTDPFHNYVGPQARPYRSLENIWWEIRQFFARSGRVPVERMGANDVLLMADIFRDSRMREVPTFPARSAVRRVAIFHDAAGLRLPGTVTLSAHRDFQDYVRSLAACDLVICISREAEADLLHYWECFGLPAVPTCIEGWPIEFTDTTRQPDANFAARKILYVSTLERRKNHPALLRAAESLWQEGLKFELQIIGRTTPWGGSVVAEITRLAQAGRAISWLKHVDDETLHRCYREASFTAYPSLQEGFGLPIQESLWHGRPCICGGNGALGEVATGGGCITLDQTNVPALAAAMRDLLDDEATYNRLHAEARARTFRNWDDYTGRLLQRLGEHDAKRRIGTRNGELLDSLRP